MLNAAERAADPDRYTSWKGQFPDLSQFYGLPWSGDNVAPSVDRSQDIQLAAAKGYDGIGLGKAMPGDEPGTVQFNTLRGPQYRKRINDDGTTQEYYVLDPVVVTGKSKATRVLEAWAQQSEPVWSFREASEARAAQDMAEYQARVDTGPQMSAITPEMDAAARAEAAQKEGLQNFLKAQGEMSVGGPVSAAMYLATRDLVAASNAADATAPIEGFWVPRGGVGAQVLASTVRRGAGMSRPVAADALRGYLDQKFGRTGDLNTDINARRDLQVEMGRLAREGHAPGRHGPRVTERALDNRALYKYDPITGTTTDYYSRGTHNVGRNATKILSRQAMRQAEAYVRGTPEFAAARADAIRNGLSGFPVQGIPLERALGPNYMNDVFGKARVGSLSNPAGTIPIDFTNGTLTSVFRRGEGGYWKLHTMYLEPNP